PREPPAFRETASGAVHDIQDELRAQQQRLREARRAKEEALKQSLDKGLIVEKRPTVWAARARTGGLRSGLLADLSQRDSLKRAVVLKEVLDRPVGLRE